MRWMILIGLGVAIGLFLIGSGVAESMRGSQAASHVISQTIVVNQEVLDAEILASVGNSPISSDQAKALAAKHVRDAAGALGSSARYVKLTLRSTDGEVAFNVQAHPVWLVTFEGLGYQPPTTGGATCSCDPLYARPNTVVALDAQTGKLIALYGTNDSPP